MSLNNITNTSMTPHRTTPARVGQASPFTPTKPADSSPASDQMDSSVAGESVRHDLATPVRLPFDDTGLSLSHLAGGTDDDSFSDDHLEDLVSVDLRSMADPNDDDDEEEMEEEEEDRMDESGEDEVEGVLVDEDIWDHMLSELMLYHYLYRHSNVSHVDDMPDLTEFVQTIRLFRDDLCARRIRQLAAVDFQYVVDEETQEWFDNLQAVHRSVHEAGAIRVEDAPLAGDLSEWLENERIGYVNADGSGIGHDVYQLRALEGLSLDWVHNHRQPVRMEWGTFFD